MCRNKAAEYCMESLMRSYGNDVLRMAYMYVRDYHLAEDVFQDVFLKVNQKLPDFHEDSSIKTWIIRITINTSKDYLKSAYNRHVVTMPDYQEDMLSSSDDYSHIEEREQKNVIRKHILELPLKYKEIVICVYFQDMTIAEAAVFLSISQGTAKSRLKRARERLRKVLERRI